MSRKRRNFTAKFKARVALDALSSDQTLAEFASNQIAKWKKQAKEGVVASFSGKQQNAVQCTEEQIKDLHAKIGQLTVEKYFLQQAFAKIW